ncbi:MAG TPA: metal-dependent hydrolase [Candidatus Angelobacter sp.]|nr:metal-dependent hydrolase [Candidatus Angelobacter sp.]
MEPVTHLLTAACMSRAGLNRTTGLATLTLVVAAEAPDADMLFFFGGSVTGLQHHRGFTHSFLGAPVVAAVTLAGVYGIYRLMQRRGRRPKLSPRWGLLFAYALLSALTHILLDFTNSYGVRPLAPFNRRWYSWDIVHIVDPVILTALILGLVTPALLGLISDEVGARKPQFRGRGGAVFALTCFLVIVFFRDFQHRRAVAALNAVTFHDQDALRASAFPSMVNPFLWTGVVETKDFFEVLPVDSGSSQLDPQNLSVFRYKPEETPVTLAAKNSRLGRAYLDWAQYPLVTVAALPARAGYRVQFQDLRFAHAEALERNRSLPLTGNVELNPVLRVEDQYLGSPPREVGGRD